MSAESETNKSNIGWNIDFRPHSHLFKTGHDPVSLFRELEGLGTLSVEMNDDALPPFYDLEPEVSYFKWLLILRGDIDESDVIAIFECIANACDLVITPLNSDSKTDSMLNNTMSDIEQSDLNEILASPIAEDDSVIETADTSINVSIAKVDSLSNMVSELAITQALLNQVGEEFTTEKLPALMEGLTRLERNTREMQERVMQLHMLPVSFSFNRLPRIVHDMSQAMAKKVALTFTGEQTEIDKNLIDKISELLIHLVRNAVEHGIELPAIRLAAGKEQTGRLQLNAFHQAGNIIIELHDDGSGLDEDKILSKAIEIGIVNKDEVLSPEKIHQLILLPELSGPDTMNDIAERGVGMDIVCKNISRLNGRIEVFSKRGIGTIFTIYLPLTPALMEGQKIRVADENYIIPLKSIVETLRIKMADIQRIAVKGELYQLADEFIPIIRLCSVFNLRSKIIDLEDGLLVIVESKGSKVGVLVDDLLGLQQMEIKSLETHYRKVIGVSGGTILSDGTVTLVLDIAEVVAKYRDPLLAKMKVNNDRTA